MSSWRDTASAQCQSDLDGLLNASLPFAQQMLAKHGEFFPYAASVSASGEVGLAAGHTGSERPASTEVLELLYEGFRGRAGDLRAVAIVSDVRLRETGEDAISIELEHREGLAMVLLLRYKKRRFGGPAYGNMTAEAGSRRIWSTPA
jgi:hypothetical protein